MITLLLLILPFISSQSAQHASFPNALTQSSILAMDIAISPDGNIYVVGNDHKLYTYSFATRSYTKILADPDLSNILRVTVDNENTPYITTTCGSTYYLSCDGRWIQLPGCSTDIGANSCGQVWKTGCDVQPGGYGVWKLFCSGKEKTCNRYRQFNYGSKYNGRINERKKCSWYKVTGAGKRIDVYPDGKVGVVQDNGIALKYNGYEWSVITKYAGNDIAVSNEGVVFMTGRNEGVFVVMPNEKDNGFYDERYIQSYINGVNKNTGIKEESNNTMYLDVGCTMAIAVGPFSQPAMVPCSDRYLPVVILTQQFDYN